MNKTKLDELLCSLEQRELKSFSSFLEWQVKVNARHERSLPAMKKIVASFIETKTGQNKSVSVLRGYNKKEQSYLTGDLSTYLQTFLVYRHAYNNDAIYNNLLLKELAKRNTAKPFHTLYKETKTRQENITADANGYYYLYEAEKKHYELSLVTEERSTIPDFKSISNYLDSHYILHKLKLFCEIANYRNVMSSHFEPLLYNEIISEVGSGKFKPVKQIMIYYYVLMTLTKPDDDNHFINLRETVMKSSADFDSDELMDFYHYLKNYCARKINAGVLAYRKTLIGIYKEMMSVKNLFRKQWLSQWDYKNAVTVSLRENEFIWAKSFIEKYVSYLAAPERKNAYRYNLAAWNFAKGNFKEARKLLQFVNMNDVFYRLDARLMMFKIYFELDDHHALYFQISSFKKFLQRNRQISDYQKSIYINFLKKAGELQKAFNSKAMLKKLQIELKHAKDVADVQWLREKVDELL